MKKFFATCALLFLSLSFAQWDTEVGVMLPAFQDAGVEMVDCPEGLSQEFALCGFVSRTTAQTIRSLDVVDSSWEPITAWRPIDNGFTKFWGYTDDFGDPWVAQVGVGDGAVVVFFLPD